MVDCTAYNVEDDQIEGKDYYLITHTNRSSKISWGQHKFKVCAKQEEGEFRCECREFEHTGLLCVHLLRAFIHIQLEKIPEQYILRRYTKNARQELEFDTHDKLPTGKDGVTKICRLKRLTSKAMAAARSGVMSEAAALNTERGFDQIMRENKIFPPDIGPNGNSGQRQAPPEVNVIGDSMISRMPPPRAKTKGRKMTETEKKQVTLGAKGEKKGTRRCSICK
ncbi:hypothetical protein HU200_034687 [Digitaria exilis]|uniref:SWIM-type domain-containing protein n=1 Tax=Digitaria exilis TaxID=1010633 RepID=A0A835BGG1_9POAL|nr:hypothetical protein HU200_034687 [Digitaria exilis]